MLWSPPFQLKRASSQSRDRQVTPFSNPIRESSFCLYTISACIAHIKLFLSLVVNSYLIKPTTSATVRKFSKFIESKLKGFVNFYEIFKIFGTMLVATFRFPKLVVCLFWHIIETEIIENEIFRKSFASKHSLKIISDGSIIKFFFQFKYCPSPSNIISVERNGKVEEQNNRDTTFQTNA